MDNLKTIETFFTQHTKYTLNEIKYCELFYKGFTNLSYKLKTNDSQIYQIKMTRFKQPTMINEATLYKQYLPDCLIYSDETGNLIKKWTIGKPFDLNIDTSSRLKLLFDEIKKFHKIEVFAYIKVFNYFIHDDILKQSSKQYALYCKILNHYKHESLVVSHNDINFKNIIMYTDLNETKLHFIDFEWVTLNYAWMDYINLFCEEEIKDEKVLKHLLNQLPQLKTLNNIYELMFVRWFFAYGWATKELNRLPNMKNYQKKCIKNLKWLETKVSF